MTTPIDVPAGWPDVPQLETNTVAVGGVNGGMNAQATALVARIKTLQQAIAAAQQGFLTGHGAPGSTIGVDGSVYLDLDAKNLYTKAAGVWSAPVSLQGPQGPAGPAGSGGGGDGGDAGDLSGTELRTEYFRCGAMGTFHVPPGVTSVRIRAWGAGGAGGGVSSNDGTKGGAGGGGGAYVEAILPVALGEQYYISVGRGGNGGTPLPNEFTGYVPNVGDGGDTVIKGGTGTGDNVNVVLVLAQGGASAHGDTPGVNDTNRCIAPDDTSTWILPGEDGGHGGLTSTLASPPDPTKAQTLSIAGAGGAAPFGGAGGRASYASAYEILNDRSYVEGGFPGGGAGGLVAIGGGGVTQAGIAYGAGGDGLVLIEYVIATTHKKRKHQILLKSSGTGPLHQTGFGAVTVPSAGAPGTITLDPAVSQFKVKMWGAGGLGYHTSDITQQNACGGGGGQYVELLMYNTGAPLHYSVGIGGGGGNSVGDTWISPSASKTDGYIAQGGGNASSGRPGIGGSNNAYGVSGFTIFGANGTVSVGTTPGNGGAAPQGGAGGSGWTWSDDYAAGTTPGGGSAGTKFSTAVAGDGLIVLEYEI